MLIEIDFPRLQRVGLKPAQLNAAQALLSSHAPLMNQSASLMRVAIVHRETIVIHDGDTAHDARIHSTFRHALTQNDEALVVGDWVFVLRDATSSTRWISARLAPDNHLARRDGSGVRHALVSNVDLAFIVMGLDDDFNPRRLERFLALVQASGVLPVVVLTKADVCTDVEALRAQLLGRVPTRVPIEAVDARDVQTVTRALGAYCVHGETIVLLGSSGAGKSTLTNSLLGATIQDTGNVREHDSRGKHTTTARTLLCLPHGGCLIDTPGVRTLQLDGDAQSLAAGFADIASLALQCRFGDCTHGSEPGCAVRDTIPADRIKNFHKLLRDAQRDTMTPLERRQQVAMWKARGRAAGVRMRAKREAT